MIGLIRWLAKGHLTASDATGITIRASDWRNMAVAVAVAVAMDLSQGKRVLRSSGSQLGIWLGRPSVNAHEVTVATREASFTVRVVVQCFAYSLGSFQIHVKRTSRPVLLGDNSRNFWKSK